MSTADVAVIGAGHNGLVCAAYLARAGKRVVLFEARAGVGGCASTVDALGARVNICNCDHLMVRATSIIDELDLVDHGLRYIDIDPAFMALTWDGAPPWFLFSDPERTIAWLVRHHPRQADAYRAYLREAAAAARVVVRMAGCPATTRNLLGRAARAGLPGVARLLSWSRRSALDVLASYFDDDALILPALVTGPAVWGLDPDMPGTGLAALGYAVRHQITVGRPTGGSGALTDALRTSFEAAGGVVRCSSPVTSIRGSGDGWLVEAGGAMLEVDAVVGACDPRTVRSDLLGEADPSEEPEGFESKLDAVIATLPSYRALAGLDLDGVDPLWPTAVVSPSLAEVQTAGRARRAGRIIERPMLLVNVPSVADPSMQTPDGRHILSLEVLWTPYSLEGGWEGSAEPRRWLEAYAGLVEPGFMEGVGPWRAMTPPDYEEQFGLRRGYAPSFRGSPVDAVLGRPRPLARHRGEHEGLYLTGSATYPGAGIWGAPGRNAANAVLDDGG